MAMTPREFVNQLGEDAVAPVYLFLGSEAYRRAVCRRKLTAHVLPAEEREAGLTRCDLDEISLADVIDDARSLSLFAPTRLIWASSAEAVVPRGRATAADHPGVQALTEYIKDPSPGVVLVFEAGRFEYHGEGKKKLERVQKFLDVIPSRNHVIFAPYSPDEAQRLARDLARAAGLKIGSSELTFLSEAVGYDASRIATEIEKLRLFTGEEGQVTEAMITSLVPNARVTTVFELVAALSQGNRKRALELLDTLVQEGEYLPLALSFLEAQFRHALIAKENRLTTAKQIADHFQQAGIRMWFKKAQEIQQTAAAFTPAELKRAVGKIYLADKALRDAHPDDRTVMEELVLSVKESK